MESHDFLNIFEEEFNRIAKERSYIVLYDVLKISLLDEDYEHKINLAHIRKNFAKF